MRHKVVGIQFRDVVARPDHTLLLTYENGEKWGYNFKPHLSKKIYAQLVNPVNFLKAQTHPYGVIWDEKTGIAYEECHSNGKPIVGDGAADAESTTGTDCTMLRDTVWEWKGRT